MRKITKLAVQAFALGEPFNLDNTTVTVDGEDVCLALHGHIIARRRMYRGTVVEVSLCGWPSNTTRERLHGLLCNLGVGIAQRKGKQVWACNGLPIALSWKQYAGQEVDEHAVYRVDREAFTITKLEGKSHEAL